MKKNKKGILVDGSLRTAGVTFYTKQGQTIARSSVSMQPERRTEKQFAVRERHTHNMSLWRSLKAHCADLMTGSANAYADFCTLAAKLPPVYLTRGDHANRAALLLPGIPVSDGTLPDIGYRLGTVEGQAALLTDLPAGSLAATDRLRLIGLCQHYLQALPRLQVDHEELTPCDFAVVDGCLALVDARFGDADRGWALVLCRDGRCSTQRVVTAATRWRDYTTPEALQHAAASFGGLTG